MQEISIATAADKLSKKRRNYPSPMSRRIHYIYNPSTDNFERYYPSAKSKLMTLGRYLFLGVVFATIFVWIAYLVLGVNNEDYVQSETRRMRQEIRTLQGRLDNALTIMSDIQNRDDNFYRVMLQLDPMKLNQRYAGAQNDWTQSGFSNRSNAEILTSLTHNIELLERQIYAQSLSFDELRKTAMNQRHKIDHVPAVLPISISDYTMSSGYGYRVDPVYGGTTYHAGLDFAAPYGTPVYATAEGTVTEAGPSGAYGNRIDIDHGYSYLTRFGHLSKINVKPGQKVRRGDKIGEVGSTGKSTGPHLHYEVRYRDVPQNPVNYYFLDITPEEYRDMINAAANAGNVMD